jgi:hypothetical protein
MERAASLICGIELGLSEEWRARRALLSTVRARMRLTETSTIRFLQGLADMP